MIRRGNLSYLNKLRQTQFLETAVYHKAWCTTGNLKDSIQHIRKQISIKTEWDTFICTAQQQCNHIGEIVEYALYEHPYNSFQLYKTNLYEYSLTFLKQNFVVTQTCRRQISRHTECSSGIFSKQNSCFLKNNNAELFQYA